MITPSLLDDAAILELVPGLIDISKSTSEPAPAFPVRIFPPVIDRYLNASARSLGVPVEMVAVPLLVIAGAVIGNRLQITLKRGFTQFPTLYAAVVGEPGVAKSPAMLAAQWPLIQLQTDMARIYRDQKSSYDANVEAWSERPKGERGSKPTPPHLEHLYSTDLTVEALASILHQNQGVAILRDEVLSWITSLDQYRNGRGSDRQFFLSLWSGAPIKSDRRGAETVYVPHPVACVYGGIQPDALPGLHDRNGRRDGFVERVLLFYPDAQPSGWNDDEIDPALAEPMIDIFRRLRKVGSPDGPTNMQLHSISRYLWSDWYNENAAATASASGLRRGYYAKLPVHVARFALILNALWNLDDPRRLVSEARMTDAIALGEFFRGHLDRVLPLIGDTSTGHLVGLPARLARILRREATQENDGWVRRRTIISALGNVRSPALTEALMSLQANDQVESRTVATATKPADEWRWIDPESHRASGGGDGNRS